MNVMVINNNYVTVSNNGITLNVMVLLYVTVSYEIMNVMVINNMLRYAMKENGHS